MRAIFKIILGFGCRGNFISISWGVITGLILTLSTSLFLYRPSQSAEILKLTTASTNGIPGSTWSSSPSISGDGRLIAFVSYAENLVIGDTNNANDIFVYDQITEEIERVSVSTTMDQANAGSSHPVISRNGRFVVFESLASNLVDNDTNNTLDVFVHDRLRGVTERVSVNHDGQGGNGSSTAATISADGRYVVFTSAATNLSLNDTNGVADVFIHDRFTKYTSIASKSSTGEEANALSGGMVALASYDRVVFFNSRATNLVRGVNKPQNGLFSFNRVFAKTEFYYMINNNDTRRISSFAVSENGDTIAYIAMDELGELPQGTLYLYDQKTENSQNLASFNLPSKTTDAQPKLALSGYGRYLVVLIPTTPGKADLVRFDLVTGEKVMIDKASYYGGISLSSDGLIVAYVKEENGGEQVFIYNSMGQIESKFSLSGRVTDPDGSPLALVTIEVSQAGGGLNVNESIETKTDPHGYYFISGLNPGLLELTASKSGYQFMDADLNLQFNRDRQVINFTSLPQAIITEARADIGMPYRFDRGCPDPREACGGPFHGFNAGYCTDIVLDAFLWGADFSIQFALEQDFRAQPWHFYRWRDARDAHDMWRYFSYSGQMHPHEIPYQLGDIVFFDWSEDGEIDHVAIVSEVDENYRPKWLLDATGVIKSNPSGLAAELPWENFHERTERGHARWSGLFEPVIPEDPKYQILQMALGGNDVHLRLIDEYGNVVSGDKTLIPGGRHLDIQWEQVISLIDPLSNAAHYTAEIFNFSDEDEAYHFTLQTVQENLITDRLEMKGKLSPGKVRKLSFMLRINDLGRLTLYPNQSLRKVFGKLWK